MSCVSLMGSLLGFLSRRGVWRRARRWGKVGTVQPLLLTRALLADPCYCCTCPCSQVPGSRLQATHSGAGLAGCRTCCPICGAAMLSTR